MTVPKILGADAGLVPVFAAGQPLYFFAGPRKMQIGLVADVDDSREFPIRVAFAEGEASYGPVELAQIAVPMPESSS